jgi:hypothetical protein
LFRRGGRSQLRVDAGYLVLQQLGLLERVHGGAEFRIALGFGEQRTGLIGERMITLGTEIEDGCRAALLTHDAGLRETAFGAEVRPIGERRGAEFALTYEYPSAAIYADIRSGRSRFSALRAGKSLERSPAFRAEGRLLEIRRSAVRAAPPRLIMRLVPPTFGAGFFLLFVFLGTGLMLIHFSPK